MNIHGFTLLETLIAITLITLLTTLSLPFLRHFSTIAHDQLLQSQLLNAIETASQEARHRGVPVVLRLDKTQSLFMIFIDENDDGIVSGKEQMIAVLQIKLRNGRLFWRAYPRYRDYLLFLPWGLMRSDNSSFWFCHANDAAPVWAVTLNKSARTRVVYPDQNGVIKDGQMKLLRCE